MIQDDVETTLKYFLQKNVKLQIGEKSLKEGRLILFTIKDFIINFTFKNHKGELKKYETPIPYEAHVNSGIGVFDYRFESLAIKNSQLYMRIVTLNSNKKSKLYNTVLHIHGS